MKRTVKNPRKGKQSSRGAALVDPVKACHFVYEQANLKRMPHAGWIIAGIPEPTRVGAHALRAAQIGYILAVMEGYDNPHEVVTMLVFHDMGETRVGDIHKIANRYVQADEEEAVIHQLDLLGPRCEELYSLWKQVDEKSTTAGRIAKDADYLEQAFGAKEYAEQGYPTTDWIKNVRKALFTKSAHKLLTTLQRMNSYDWWQGLKKLD